MSDSLEASVETLAPGTDPAAEAPMRKPRQDRTLLIDRTAVLMIGVAVGAMIGLAFAREAHESAPKSAVVQVAPSTPAPQPAATPAAAAIADWEGPMPLLRTLAAGGPVRIGVFGDSFGDGVWAALYRRFPPSSGYQVIKFSQQATGFTRYQQINLEERARGQLADASIDIAVINFGANDTQGLYDGAHAYGMGSRQWRKVYADRAERFVGVLRDHGAAVYWMGLPKMRRADYDEQVDVLSDTVKARMDRLRIPYVEVKALSLDKNGAYSDYLDAPTGRSIQMRASDGVHMTAAGYARLTQPIAERITDLVEHDCAIVLAVSGEDRPAARACPKTGRKARAPPVKRAWLIPVLMILGAGPGRAQPADAPCAQPICQVDELAPFLALLAHPEPDRVISIVQIGDSHTANENFAGAWRALLQARLGDAGRGAMPPGRPWASYTSREVTVSADPSWSFESVMTAAKDGADTLPFGASGYRVSAPAEGATMGLTGDDGRAFRRLVVCAETGPGAGVLTLGLGARSVETSLQAQARGVVCPEIRADAAQSGATVTTAGGPVTLYSWATYSGAPGAVVSNLGVVGSKVAQMALNGDPVLKAEFDAYRPDVIVIAYGTNEGFDAHIAIDDYAEGLTEQIRRLRRLAPGVPILLLDAPDGQSKSQVLRTNGPPGVTATTDSRGWFSPPGLAWIRAAQHRVAAREHVALWSWCERMGGPDTAGDWPLRTPALMRPDHVHFTVAGGQALAERLEADLDAAAGLSAPAPS